MAEIGALIAEAKGLELFRPHGAFEVHCAHCHARLDGNGDCATCGLIGRPAAVSYTHLTLPTICSV